MSVVARSAPSLVIAVGLVACLQCSSPPTLPPPAPGEAWAASPPAEWPRFTLVNRIQYADSKHPVAGSGFLIATGDGVVAATAKHVLTYFKSEDMDSVSFGGTLEHWTMVPKDRPESVVTCGELINEDSDESLESIPVGRDWLLLSVRERSPDVVALQLREEPVQGGEAAFVVGWRYTEREGPPVVHEARVVGVDEGSVLIDARGLRGNVVGGLSGAPVVDARGRVIGMMSRGSGKLQRLSSVDYPRRVLAEAGGTP